MSRVRLRWLLAGAVVLLVHRAAATPFSRRTVVYDDDEGGDDDDDDNGRTTYSGRNEHPKINLFERIIHGTQKYNQKISTSNIAKFSSNTTNYHKLNKTGPQIIYTGQSAIKSRDIVDTTFPIDNGIITDWDAMEYISNQMYYEDLLVPPEDYNILHTESVINDESGREKLVETMFESFNVPSMSVVPTSMLSLFSNGQTNGIVVHSGYQDTVVVPIFEGYPLEHAVRTLPVGGHHISLFMMKLMNDRGHDFNHFNDLENLRNMKEMCCYYSVDYEKELIAYSKSMDQLYTLPDGMVVNVTSEAFQAPEILFNPGMANIESELGGLHDVIYDAYKACSLSEENDMTINILLAGGNSLIPFLPDRLKQMLTSVTSPGMNVEIIEKPERKYASWIGGSILASISDYQPMWISRKEYDEKGVSVVHTKCC